MNKRNFFFILIVGVMLMVLGIGFFTNTFVGSTSEKYELDKSGIIARSSLRVAVDNNSSSYYIYRGTRMGYEYELLLDFAERLGVQVELVVPSDIDEAFQFLDEGKVDIIAMNLEENINKGDWISFSQPLGIINTVLVGRKNGRKEVSWDSLGRDSIIVRKGAVYSTSLKKIKDSLDLGFTIVEVPDHEETLIDQVADGIIDWTVSESSVARTNATYYEELYIPLAVSSESSVVWALRKTSPELLKELNSWIIEKKPQFITGLYKKYFQNSKYQYFHSNSPFSSLGGNRISEFDELIKDGASDLGWDWRLLAALVYKESRFDTSAVSYAGAQGLLQLMPITAQQFGVSNPNDPVESLRGGVRFLNYLDKFWLERVPDTKERIQFILASYNMGHGHVEDAWRLALKYGKNTQSWKEVSFFLNLKSDPKYYRDPVVKSGYAKGHIAVNYTREVLGLFHSYKDLVAP